MLSLKSLVRMAAAHNTNRAKFDMSVTSFEFELYTQHPLISLKLRKVIIDYSDYHMTIENTAFFSKYNFLQSSSIPITCMLFRSSFLL